MDSPFKSVIQRFFVGRGDKDGQSPKQQDASGSVTRSAPPPPMTQLGGEPAERRKRGAQPSDNERQRPYKKSRLSGVSASEAASTPPRGKADYRDGSNSPASSRPSRRVKEMLASQVSPELGSSPHRLPRRSPMASDDAGAGLGSPTLSRTSRVSRRAEKTIARQVLPELGSSSESGSKRTSTVAAPKTRGNRAKITSVTTSQDKPPKSKRGRKPKARTAKSNAQESRDESDTYTVRSILDYRPSPDSPRTVMLRVAWAGFPNSADDTWEEEESLQEACPRLLFAFWQGKGGRNKVLNIDDETGTFDVFKLSDHKKVGRKLLIKTYWVGYAQPSWEPRGGLPQALVDAYLDEHGLS